MQCDAVWNFGAIWQAHTHQQRGFHPRVRSQRHGAHPRPAVGDQPVLRRDGEGEDGHEDRVGQQAVENVQLAADAARVEFVEDLQAAVVVEEAEEGAGVQEEDAAADEREN